MYVSFMNLVIFILYLCFFPSVFLAYKGSNMTVVHLRIESWCWSFHKGYEWNSRCVHKCVHQLFHL